MTKKKIKAKQPIEEHFSDFPSVPDDYYVKEAPIIKNYEFIDYIIAIAIALGFVCFGIAIGMKR